MQRHLTSLLTLSAFAIATPAMAKSSHAFETDITAQLTGPVKVEVVIGEDLAYRANNLPKKLSDRGSSRSYSDGFSGNGYYGEKDLNRLADKLAKRVSKELTQDGVSVVDNSPTVLRLVITDARPNRPTFEQMGKQPGLSFRSVAIGGASFEGEVIRAGQSTGTMSYAWYETDIRDAAYGSATWSDAKRAISRFADKVSDNLAERDPGAS